MATTSFPARSSFFRSLRPGTVTTMTLSLFMMTLGLRRSITVTLALRGDRLGMSSALEEEQNHRARSHAHSSII